MECESCGVDKASVTEETTEAGETVRICEDCRIDTTAPAH